jgi:hypothetical protein
MFQRVRLTSCEQQQPHPSLPLEKGKEQKLKHVLSLLLAKEEMPQAEEVLLTVVVKQNETLR